MEPEYLLGAFTLEIFLFKPSLVKSSSLSERLPREARVQPSALHELDVV